MKKRILSLVMVMPFIIMLLAFGFSKTVNLFVDLQPEFLYCDYDENEAFEFSGQVWENGVELNAGVYPANATNSEIVWSLAEEEAFDGLPLSEDHPIAEIRNGRLYKYREGIVYITATVPNTGLTKTFRAYLIDDDGSFEPKFVIIRGRDTSENSIKSTENRYYGLYDLINGEKVKRTETFTAKVYPSSAPQEIDVTLANADGCAEILSEENTADGLVINVGLISDSGDNSAILRAEASGTDKAAFAFFKIADGVNVYSYDDLMYCTDEAHPEITVMRVNLESRANVAVHKNSALFGRETAAGVSCEWRTIKSTYDVRYYENGGEADKAVIKAGVTFRKNVYGNGYTINAHELCYPSSVMEKYETVNGENVKVGETASPSFSDPFQGPLIFVMDLSCACYGQDNIGFLIEGDGIVIDNLTLKNCNNVNDLSNLDYVGTVVEVAGDDVRIKNCQIMNGRTVVRSMSNDNLIIESCILSYAREFILKVGSNKFVYAEPYEWGSSNRPSIPSGKNAAYAFLSPDSDNDVPLKGAFDSTATVKDTYFHTSGVFCVGMDTHFAGTYLYNRNARINNMAATSYPSKLSLVGDVRFYDWKSVAGLDSSTLITAGTADDGRDFSGIFPISEIIENYYNDHRDTNNMILEYNGQNYVHGGVAFFGGGRNLSVVDFDGLDTDAKSLFSDLEKPFLIALDDGALGLTSNILVNAAGYGEFIFYMYNPDRTEITVGSMPKIADINPAE
ncbi:MAG: hypothetical protein J6Z34_06280 [Clostridia bacterium]|nr:hypothetical protein [Clostridia bacterium]